MGVGCSQLKADGGIGRTSLARPGRVTQISMQPSRARPNGRRNSRRRPTASAPPDERFNAQSSRVSALLQTGLRRSLPRSPGLDGEDSLSRALDESRVVLNRYTQGLTARSYSLDVTRKKLTFLPPPGKIVTKFMHGLLAQKCLRKRHLEVRHNKVPI